MSEPNLCFLFCGLRGSLQQPKLSPLLQSVTSDESLIHVTVTLALWPYLCQVFLPYSGYQMGHAFPNQGWQYLKQNYPGDIVPEEEMRGIFWCLFMPPCQFFSWSPGSWMYRQGRERRLPACKQDQGGVHFTYHITGMLTFVLTGDKGKTSSILSKHS